MRRLFLLRHAQAAPGSQSSEDRHRQLTADGAASATALAHIMRAKGYIPEFIICSPARRTQQTMAKLLAVLGDIPSISPAVAYYSTTGQLYDLIKQADSSHLRVLLISHNPSIHGLAKMLTAIKPGEILSPFTAEYKECTLSVLDCPVNEWSALMPGENDLEDLLIPNRDFSPRR